MGHLVESPGPTAPEECKIIDTAVMTLLTTAEEKRDAMMELLTITYAREMRHHWPDMPGKEIFSYMTRLMHGVEQRLCHIRALGGTTVGTA